MGCREEKPLERSHAARAEPRPRVVAGLRLVRLVGRGGEGEVWESRDGIGRRRALKLIRPDALVEPDQVESRGRLLLRVSHPALVRVRRVGLLSGARLDGWGFVEMDFVDGRCLAAFPADPEALARLRPLAEALDALHRGAWSDGVPLVHRDIKPANLIETDAGLVLVDHSTLRSVDHETITRIGTPVFAAPEVLTGRIGPAADRYSLAATAVALLTGARGSALADLLAAPWELDVPDGVRAGLASRPEERPSSALAIVDEAPLIGLGDPVTVRFADDPAVRLGGDPPVPRRFAVAALRRAWARAVVTGALVLLAAVIAAPWLAPATGLPPPDPMPHGGAVAIASVLLVVAVGASSRARIASRLLLLPLWAVGALVLVAGAVAALVPAALLGQAGRVGLFAARTVLGVVVVALPGRRDEGHNARDVHPEQEQA